MKYLLNYNNFIVSEDLLFSTENIENNDLTNFFCDRRFLLEFAKTEYFEVDERNYLIDTLIENEDEIYLNEDEIYLFYGEDELLIEDFKSFLYKTGRAFIRTGSAIKRGFIRGTKHIGNMAKTVGNKLVKAAKATGMLIHTIINEFDKAFLFFTKASKRDVQVSASWTLKKYPQVQRAASKATGEEKSYFENVITFLNNFLNRVKNTFKSAVNQAVHESLIYDEDGYKLITEVEEYLKEDGALVSAINKAHTYVEKDTIDGTLPKGTIARIKDVVSKSMNAIDSLLDTFYKTRTRLTIMGFAKAIKLIGGPSEPTEGFPNVSTVYTLSGIHTQGGALGGGMMKNWKHSLGFGIRTAMGKAAGMAAVAAAHSLGIVSLGIPYILKVVKIIKKAQVTSLILKISAGEANIVKVKDHSWLSKKAE